MAELSTRERDKLPERDFAYVDSEGGEHLPIHDASHVRNALARFDQVEDVSDADRELAFANIKKAAAHYDIDVEARSWHELGKQPHTANRAHR